MKSLIVSLILTCTIVLNAQDSLVVEKFLSGVKVYDIAGDESGIWVGSNGNGVYHKKHDAKRWRLYSSDNSKLQNNFIYTIEADENYVYAGSSDGLFIFDKRRERWSKRKFGKGGQLSNWIRDIQYDSKNNIVWIGRFKYLTKLDLNRRRFTDYDLTVSDNKKTNNIQAVAVDGDSLVWFGTEAGMHKYDKSRSVDANNAIVFYDNRLNYFNGEGETVSISDIVFVNNYMWIGLDEFVTPERPDFNLGGVFRYDRKNEWIKIDTKSGLNANGVYDIERTGDYLWVSMYQFGERTKEEFGRGLNIIDTNTLKVIPIFNDNIPDTIYALYYDGKYLWMGAKDGIYRIDLSNEFANWN